MMKRMYQHLVGVQSAHDVRDLLREIGPGFQQQRVFFGPLDRAIPDIGALNGRIAVCAGDEVLRQQRVGDRLGGLDGGAVDEELDDGHGRRVN